MADRNVTIGIDIVADATKAAAAMDSTSAAASHMGDSISAASDQAKRADAGFSSAADGADALASKSSQATGGIGALASGFELVGLEGFAGGMQSAAMATDFFSGVGDIANLMLESQAIQTVKNTALKVKDAVVTKGQAVATGVMTGAQWALNAAMTASPIGIVIAAVVALIAVVVIAYNKSDKFREIVDKALNKVKEVAGVVFGWLKDHWKLILAILTGPFGLAVLAITKFGGRILTSVTTAFTKVKTEVSEGIGDVVGFIKEAPGKILDFANTFKDAGKTLIGKFIEGLKNVGTFAAGLGKSIIDGVIGALNTGIQWINDHLPDKISLPGLPDIDLPDNPIPTIPTLGSGGTTASGSGAFRLGLPALGSQEISITVQGAIDPYSTALQVKALLDRADTWRGKVVTLNA